MSATAASLRGPSLYPLRRFQADAVDAMTKVIVDTARTIEIDRSRRFEIGRAMGITLLRSPTGSGKTLTVGRTLQNVIGKLPMRTVWLWFTPFSGLVAQTRDALSSQCPGLRMRDAATDRSLQGTRDGDVFVLTWQSVASARQESRRLRSADERLPSIDLLLAALREDFYVGVIIDESHLNFGTGAPQAAAFYLDVVLPDFTILATATPRDIELERFQRAAGIADINRIEVSRDQVVRACLNKVGVKAVHFRPDERDARILDMQEVAILAGLTQHKALKAALAEAEIDLKPLLLIQVDNVSEDGVDPVERVRAILKDSGILPENAPGSPLAVHTSAEPDPHFHTLAYDETKEILVFKMSAATGFDAPRAWTLVSLRRSVGPDFGLQVIGRIMRVHPRLQHLHPFASDPPRLTHSILDYGYVFLANSGQQLGLIEAARELTALRDSIETVTDNIVVVRIGAEHAVLLNPDGGFTELLTPPPQPEPPPGDSASQKDPAAEYVPPASKVRTGGIRVQPLLDDLWAQTRFGGAGNNAGEADAEPSGALGLTPYLLRNDIAFPRILAREVMPKTMANLVQCIARRIEIDDAAVGLVQRTLGRVHITEEEIFGSERATRMERVPLSAARIAMGAQSAFRFNDSIDERDLKPVLVEKLRRELEDRGVDNTNERHLRRGVDLLALARPQLLTDACRACLAEVVEIKQDEEIPGFYTAPADVERAAKNLYGVFPTGLNKEELAFARLLDEDDTGTVLWWIRNQSMARWAVSIVLPSGERHFPDFVIGADARRRSENNIALAEVKDDGRTGRLFADKNTEKVRTEHARYRSCLMVFRNDQGDWFNVAYRPEIQRHQAGSRFRIDDLVRTV